MKVDYCTVNERKIGSIIVENNLELPLFIYIHGGPFVSEFTHINNYFTQLFEHFICVFPDQFGSGLSYAKEKPRDVSSYADDIIRLTEHYLKQYSKKSAILCGHAFGTIPAMLAVEKRPDLFSHYIGMSQIINYKNSLLEAYQFVMENGTVEDRELIENEVFQKNNLWHSKANIKLVSTLRKHNRAGSYQGKFSDWQLLVSMWRLPCYSLSQKINIIRSYVSDGTLLKSIVEEDFSRILSKLVIPTILIHGEFDLLTSYRQVLEFSNNHSSVKFITIKNGAHFPFVDAPDKVMDGILNNL